MRIEAGEPKGLRGGSDWGAPVVDVRAGRGVTPALRDDDDSRRGLLVTEAAVESALADKGRVQR